MQLERRQGRDLGWEVVVARSLATNGGDRQDEVADLGRFLQPAALSQEKHSLGLAGAEQVHNGGGVGRADTEIDDREAVGVGRRLHGLVESMNLAPEALGELPQVGEKVGQQDVITEQLERHAGVAGKPVPGNLQFIGH